MVLDKKCKGCGAKIVFDPKSQKMHCEYCNSKYEITEETPEEIKNDSKDLDVYHCPSCGAQIVSEPNTTSTFCVYCKNTAILKNKLTGEFLPQAIIPFHKTKQEAIDGFVKLRKGKRLVPNEFLDPKNIEEIKGIYIPFWFFDYQIESTMSAKAKTINTLHTQNSTTIVTKEYLANRKGSMIFDNIPVDGSTHFQDNIMRSIEPFNYQGLKKYSSDYLSGFLSELYNVKKEDAFLIANERAKKTTYDLLYNNIKSKGYDTVDILDNTYNIVNTNSNYVLLPVWMLNVKYQNNFYTFAMNGQTGEMIGNIPIDKKKSVKYFWIAFAISLIVCIIIAIFVWKLVW